MCEKYAVLVLFYFVGRAETKAKICEKRRENYLVVANYVVNSKVGRNVGRRVEICFFYNFW